MIILTAGGSFAQTYLNQFDAEVASIRELGEAKFVEKIRKAKSLIHNAATIECNDLDQCLVRNFDFTRNLVNQAQAVNPGLHLIFLSSMSILDPSNSKAYGDVLGMTAYAYSKYLAEIFCLKSELKNVSCVRFSTLFYRDHKKDGLSKLASDAVTAGKITIFNQGEARRNFLPLRIAAQYISKLTEQHKPGKRVYTLASAQSTSFADIASLLQKHIPGLEVQDEEIPAAPPVLSEFSTDSIDELGRIKFSLEEEIAEYIKSLRS